MGDSMLRAAAPSNPLIPPVIEIVLGAAFFLVLVLLVQKFVAPRFEQAFAERTAAIEGGLSAAETKQAEADARLAELEQEACVVHRADPLPVWISERPRPWVTTGALRPVRLLCGRGGS